jgi:uncharacterized surface protein with fasciclin (FAS1) repeats
MKKIKLLICSLFLIGASVNATNYNIDSGDYYYSPSSLTVNVGDTVSWTNLGGYHNVNFYNSTISGNSFNNPVSFISSPTGPGLMYTHVFTVAGSYEYDCSVGSHAANGMVATITVNGAASNTIYDIVSNSSVHLYLKACLDTTSLDAVFSDNSANLTLFAPTDAAFIALPPGTVAALLGNLPLLSDILKHHAVSGTVLSSSLSNNLVVTTLLGSDVTVTINSTGVFIDNAQVIVADILADNGVVHVIDVVLLPAIDCANIVDGTALEDSCGTCQQAYLYNFQTNVPTFVDNANILVAGVDYDPSSQALIFPDDPNNPLWVSDPTSCSNTIYDIVSASADHTTLKVAIDACGLNGVLSDPGSLTLFAPTDAAFNALPAGTVTALLADIPLLTDILKHHVVGASVMSSTLSNNQVVTTLLGTDVTVTINSMGVYIDNAMVTVADIEADNGVVHVIDAVLLPPTTSVLDYITLNKEYLYSVNILGKKVSDNLRNQIIFNIFKDGSVEKVFNR